MKRLIRATSQNKILQLADRIAEIKDNIQTAQIEGLDEDYIADLYQELNELEDELNFAWQDDESEWNYAREQQEFNPDGSLKLYASTNEDFVVDLDLNKYPELLDRQLAKFARQEVIDAENYIGLNDIEVALDAVEDEYPSAHIELINYDGEVVTWSVNGYECSLNVEGYDSAHLESAIFRESEQYIESEYMDGFTDTRTGR